MKNKIVRSSDELELKDSVISIKRVTKVVKGGKNMSFSALVIVGNGNGIVGFGSGKASEVPIAIKKGIESAKKNLIKVTLHKGTLPHEVVGKFGAGKVLIKPAKEGKGVIAGAALRSVLQVLGVRDAVTKVLGSNNPANIVRATFNGLSNVRSREQVALARGKNLTDI
ncbi:30S ribosomal protein S5 [Chloracidobacterium validum]|uniref:Small ribosomal subunit protein uS5 n=1 Tax=Chloracidobacterium validum TaxID=2821543 RepID=A0ABX8BD70_9BACT|nr:30S ribosomal protein S5 [Chloracidobacterium validum]QUW03485.1 30S ribosomal protein S5 [Chloracidobacterium validum]